MLCWPTLTYTSWTLTRSWAKRPSRSHEIFKENTVAALQDSCLHVNWTVGGQRFRFAHPSKGHKARDMSCRNRNIVFLPQAVNFTGQILVFSVAALQTTPDELLNHAEFVFWRVLCRVFFLQFVRWHFSFFCSLMKLREKDNGNLECLTAITKMPVVCYWFKKNLKIWGKYLKKNGLLRLNCDFLSILFDSILVYSILVYSKHLQSHASICLLLIFI